MPPSPGPTRMTFTTRQGTSAPAKKDTPSDIRLIPGLELAVMVRTPAAAAPNTMLMAATSDSDCRKTPPSARIQRAM